MHRYRKYSMKIVTEQATNPYFFQSLSKRFLTHDVHVEVGLTQEADGRRSAL